MYKKLLICGVTLILLLTACNQTTDKQTNVGSAPGSYLYYTTADGLYRVDSDGLEKTLLKSGGDLRYIGSLNGRVYFTGEDNRLYKTDVNGQQETLVSSEPVSDAIIVKETLYYIQTGRIFGIDTEDSAKSLAQIPQAMLELPFNLKTNGTGLYLCTYAEKGSCNVYGCDLVEGKFDLQAADIYDNPFVLYKDQVIQIGDSGGDNQIFEQRSATGKKQVLLSYTGFLYDMDVCGDWLLFITKPSEGGKTYMNGFNLSSGLTFQLEAPGDHICETLATGVLIMNSKDLSMSRFIINNGQPSFGALS